MESRRGSIAGGLGPSPRTGSMLGSMMRSFDADRWGGDGGDDPAMLMKIVQIQRRFRMRQAQLAKQVVQEQQRVVAAEEASNVGLQQGNGMDRTELAKLRQERQDQALVDNARTGGGGTMVFEARARLRYGAVNFRQYSAQMELLQDTDGSLPVRCLRGQLHPYEPCRVWWDVTIILAVAYTAVWEPYKAAFLDIESSVLDWLVDAFFWADILLSFSTGYETGDGLRVDFQRLSVVKQYVLRPNGLFVDLFATMPWISVFKLFEPGLGLRRPLYRLIRMLRLLRLLRAPRLINRLTEHRNWAIHSVYIDFTKFTVYVVFLAHVLACSFFLWPAVFVSECAAAPAAGEDGTAADGVEEEEDCTPLGSWRDAETLQGTPAMHQYVWALYWSVTTITTIGFGDVTPVLRCEIVFTIFAEMFGMAFFALLVDQVVRLSDVLDDNRREDNERKNQVVQFMNHNDLDEGFRERVLEFMYFRATSASRRSFDPSDPRFEHLSPALVEEMRKKIFRPVLRKVRLFDIDSKVPLAFVDALAMCITSNPFSPSDTIVPRGAYGNALCIVLTGQVVISRSGVKRRLILSDDGQPIFGVSATLDEREFHSAQSELEEWSAESISYCDIAKIEHDAFKLAQAQTWPEGEQVMRRVARAELLRSDGVKMTNALGDKVRSTVWVGNIPGRYATESRVKQLMGPFGVIQSATVRQKSGKNKSWAFVTFESPDSATRALEAEIDVYGETDGNGKQLYLKVKEADLQNALSKGGAASKGGAIAAVLVKHATESHDYAQHAPTEEHTEEAVTPASSRRAITKTTESVPELPSASDSVGSADTDDEPIGAAYLTDQLISSMPLFEGLTPAERGALAQVLQTVSYPDGYAIVNQGDIGQTMFVLAVGTAVATMTVDVSAPPQQLKFYKSGDYFGELALMSNQPRSATVSAQGAVTCFTIERAQFQTLSFSQRFLEVLQKGAERSFRPTLTKSPSSTRLTPPPTTGKRNVSLVDVKKMRRQQPSVDAAMNSSQDIVAMLLSTGSTGSGTDGASVQPPVALDVNTRVAAHSHQLTASRLEQLQERQDGLSTQVEAVSRSVAELKDEMAARFDRLEAALSASLPPQSAAGQQQQQQQQREESA